MKGLFTVAVLAMSCAMWAQNEPTEVKKDTVEGWQFTTVDSLAITPVKNQNRSSTCWAFSALGFLEYEVMRTKGQVVDFSEMFVVSKTMMDRANY